MHTLATCLFVIMGETLAACGNQLSGAVCRCSAGFKTRFRSTFETCKKAANREATRLSPNESRIPARSDTLSQATRKCHGPNRFDTGGHRAGQAVLTYFTASLTKLLLRAFQNNLVNTLLFFAHRRRCKLWHRALAQETGSALVIAMDANQPLSLRQRRRCR